MSHRSTRVHVTLATKDKLAKLSSLQVEEVDEGLLRFQQLEELVLSANNISRVTSAHLPRTLKVSEQGLVQDGAGIPMWEHSESQTAREDARNGTLPRCVLFLLCWAGPGALLQCCG